MRVSRADREFGAGVVRHRVRSGRWQRPCRGVIVLHNAPLTEVERDAVALASASPRSALAGPAALRHDGFDAKRDGTFLVLPTGARPPSWGEAVVHWSGELRTDDVHPNRTPRRTRPSRSVLDAASWHRQEQYARWVVIAAMQAGLVTAGQLRDALGRRGPCRHRAVITASILDAEGGIDSLPERDFRELWHATGLPSPRRQQRLRTASGVYYLDVWSDHFDFGVEVHGIPHHAVDQWDRDLLRANEVAIGGRRTLVFSSFAVRRHPDVVAAQILRMARSPRTAAG